jgi:hypothetical protein
MKDDLRYTPSDCFETFPFPEAWESNAQLEAIGREYYEFRAKLMVETRLGLTKTYNRFHDPDVKDPQIVRLRDLHAAIDRAVLDAYGWMDLQPIHEFLLDYEEDEDDSDPDAAPSHAKKPWRYRWPDAFRDELLARLLALNAARAAAQKPSAPLSSTRKARGSKAASTLGPASVRDRPKPRRGDRTGDIPVES